MAVEAYANLANTTVTAGGTTAPAGGTTETWTVSSSASFPAVSTGVTQLHVADISANSEIILVTNISGTTWSVTRGAESTTPVAHAAGFTVYQVTTAGWLNAVSGAERPATLLVAASNASTAWKNTADYVCTGTADDVKINAALAALPAQGGTVLLSDGTFTISNPVIPTVNNSRLLGQGLNATNIVAAVGANCNGYQFDVSQAVSLIFCAIEGITFNGNYNAGAGNTGGYGCHVNYNLTHTFWDFYLRDVWFTNWAQDGFWSTGGHGYVLDHVLAEFCGGNGINFTGGFTDSPPRIVNGTVKINSGNGVMVACVDAYVGHMEISANTGSYGLVLSASGAKAAGNQIIDNTGSGVHITGGSEGCELTANTVGFNGQHGLLLDDANTTVTGNFFVNNSDMSNGGTTGTADEINIAHGTFTAAGNQIVGNIIDCASSSRYGINFSVSTDTAGVAVANRIVNPVTAPINTAASDTLILAGRLAGTDSGGSPSGCIAQTMPWWFVSGSGIAVASGTLQLHAVTLPGGVPVSNITFAIGSSSGTTLTHGWYALLNSALLQVAHTADQTSGSLAAGTAVTKALVTPFTPAATGLYFIGIMVVAGAQPTLCGAAGVQGGSMFAEFPSNGPSSTGLTTPGTDGTTSYSAISAAGNPVYGYCS